MALKQNTLAMETKDKINLSKYKYQLKTQNPLTLIKLLTEDLKTLNYHPGDAWLYVCILFVEAQHFKLPIDLEDVITTFQDIYNYKISRTTHSLK